MTGFLRQIIGKDISATGSVAADKALVADTDTDRLKWETVFRAPTYVGYEIITASNAAHPSLYPNCLGVVAVLGGGGGGGGAGGSGGAGGGGGGSGGQRGAVGVVIVPVVPATWNISIGAAGTGGTGGVGSTGDGQNGTPGTDGGTTTLTWVADSVNSFPPASYTITAPGGRGGGKGNGGDTNDWANGGQGGSVPASTASISVSHGGGFPGLSCNTLSSVFDPTFIAPTAGQSLASLSQYATAHGGDGGGHTLLSSPGTGGLGGTTAGQDGGNASEPGIGGGGGCSWPTGGGTGQYAGDGGLGGVGAVVIAYYKY